MQHDAWFFIGIFAFIFLIWIATGGPTHPLAYTGPALNQPEELGGGDYLDLPRARVALRHSYISSSGGSNTNAPGTTSNIPLPIYGIPYGTPSPHRGIVSMSRVSNASSTKEYLIISVSRSAPEPVNISGWILKSEVTIKSAMIPSGTVIPRPGTVPTLQDIVLRPGDRAIVSTGASPAGTSFRENKCIGYYSEFQTFSPSLPRSCPSASSELSAYYGTSNVYDPGCVDYAKTVNRCEAVLFPPKTISPSCKKFAERYFNYGGCVATHSNDADFHGTTWRIYLSRVNSKGVTRPMWRAKREIVRLLDAQGKTVAQFSY